MRRTWHTLLVFVCILIGANAWGQITRDVGRLLSGNEVYVLIADVCSSPAALGSEPAYPRLCTVRAPFDVCGAGRPDEAELETIQEFGPCGNLQIRQFDGLRLVTLAGTFGPEGSQQFGLRSLSYDDPENIRSRDFVEPAPDETLLLEKGSRAYAALYWAPQGGKDAKLLLVNLETMKEESAPADQWEYAKPDGPLVPGAPWPLGRRIEDISVSVPSKEQVELTGKRCPPYVEDPEDFSLAYNDTNSLVLFAPEPVDEFGYETDSGRALHFDKHAETWRLFEQSGNRSILTMLGPWLISWVRHVYPESDRFGPVPSGVSRAFNVQTGKTSTLVPGEAGECRILRMTEKAAFATADSILCWVPFKPDSTSLSSMYRAYQCSHEEMPFVQVLFLRPRPEKDGESKD